MPTRILQAGRLKAYRPLPAPERAAALAAALDAWDRGDWFETHERLEPAWMGTDDLAERLLAQGLIKLAAAFVHGARGNRAGIRINLLGAEDRLADALTAGSAAAAGVRSAVTELVAALDDPERSIDSLEPPDLRRLLGRAEAAGGTS